MGKFIGSGDGRRINKTFSGEYARKLADALNIHGIEAEYRSDGAVYTAATEAELLAVERELCQTCDGAGAGISVDQRGNVCELPCPTCKGAQS